MSKISVTVEGANRVELAKQLRAFAANLDGAPAAKSGKVQAADDEDETEVDDDSDDEEESKPAKKKAGKKVTKKKVVDDNDEDDSDDDDSDDDDNAETEDDDDDDADEDTDSDDSDDEDEKPAKKKAPAKKAKVTIKDVNAACKAYAKSLGKTGFEKTQALLKKKFKVSSISDLKPEHYATAVKLLAV